MDQLLPSAGGYSISRHQAHAPTPANQHQHQQSAQIQIFPSPQLPSPTQLRQPFPPRHDAHQQPQAGWYHRTSNSRDELHPAHVQQHNHHQQQQQQTVTVKRESIGNITMQKDNASSSSLGGRTSLDDAMPSTSDFVKKLYKMLEDQSFQHVVSWGPQGDCFVVKDMNEFTKSILPRLFKHSNFASFVRQLNKYDFHKVKNTDDLMQFGEQSWTFRHPDFHADRREALENIKRKVPAQRKQQQAAAAAAAAAVAVPHISSSHHRSRHHSRRHRSRSPTYSQYSRSTSPDSEQIHELQAQIVSLQGQLRAREARERELEDRLRVLERGHGEISQGLVGVQRGLAMQDRMVQGLVGGWVGVGGQGTDQKSQPSALDPVSGGLGLNTSARPHSGSISATSPSTPSALQPQTPAGPSSAPPIPSVPSLPSIPSIPSIPLVSSIGASLPQNQQYAPFLPAPTTAGSGVGIERPEDVARASLVRVGEYQRQKQQEQERRGRSGSSASASASMEHGGEQEEYVMPTPQRDWVGAGAEHEALHVYTVGHLMPRTGEGWYEQQQQGHGQGQSRSRSHSQSQSQSQSQGQGRYGFGEAGGSPQQAQASTSTAVGTTSDAQNMLRVRRSTFVPGWAVPPRVLLVDDDAVSRKLGSKFLQVFGCTIDVAVDGISAVNKMNLEKYDLVLMDIVMPKMDGVSATSMIRQFDAMTPIISMTSNSKPNEIMTYYSSGMNDILPKPFTKEGLLDMLEKHLMHLKVIQQQMRSTSVPRSIGVPPLSDSGFEAAFTPGVIAAAAAASTSTSSTSPSSSNTNPTASSSSTTTLTTTSSSNTLTGAMDLPFTMSPPPFGFDAEADGRINPLAGMGLTDEQYNMILQNIVAGEGLLAGVDGSGSAGSGMGASVGRREKRGREEEGEPFMGMGTGDERDGKRSRFEVVE
ncbi:hypothetical protein C0995_003299 [Termitomyces sp. Mi166|nr:hypothetical protein C0995_003299 [Termitomyces sp. Mi166\